ncbi:hypothetical protein BHE74_00025841 [Ensete ventricosum]|nr:hypothetical protein BHE74_00025841 [Ensete ventricosum]
MPCESSEEMSLPSFCHCVKLSLRSAEVAYPYCATCFGRCYPNGATLIMEQRGMLDGVSQLLAAIPPPMMKGSRNSLDSKEEKHPTDGAGATMAENGALVNDEEPGSDNHTDQSSTGIVPTDMDMDGK